LVVPRSMPMTLPMVLISSFLRQVGRVLSAPDQGDSAKPAGPRPTPF
jgi:hypothetical protein